MLTEAANGAEMAIVFGNILDTIPGCLVIGAKFTAFGSFIADANAGDVSGRKSRRAAASAFHADQGRLPPRGDLRVFGRTVLVAGVVAAAAGKGFHRQQ